MTEYIQVVTTVDRAEEAAAVIAQLAQNFEHSPRLTIGDAKQPPGERHTAALAGANLLAAQWPRPGSNESHNSVTGLPAP